MPEPIRAVYVPCPDPDTADAISDAAMDAGLAACANLLEATSVYPWGGERCRDAETVALLKTVPAHVDALTALVEEEHPYDTPCIMVLQGTVNDAYASWLADHAR